MSSADAPSPNYDASIPKHVVPKQSVFNTIMSQPELSSKHYSHTIALHRPVPVKDDSPYSIDQLTRRSLPYFMPWQTTAGPAELPPDFSFLTNSCGGKAAIGVFGGGVMGLLMGVFLGAMSDATPPLQVIGGKDVPQAPLREQVKLTMRATADKSLYWCRNFAFITGVFGGSECLVEKYRGTHDRWNSVASGCITGAVSENDYVFVYVCHVVPTTVLTLSAASSGLASKTRAVCNGCGLWWICGLFACD